MNPNALETKAVQRGWRVTSESDANGPMLTLVRDEWELWVAFAGTAPESATLRKPGRTEHKKVNLREIGMWVRRDRGQMNRFAIGDRITIKGRCGTITDISLNMYHSSKLRLTVSYDDGGTATFFSDQVRQPYMAEV
ncbi:hypothetical protein [Nonomuraea longicatena]|uniref:Uncharacterized protein n=1 Tax=Nonomuraea longicatena TaxID=83682 RepID=A0ABN1NUF3_9ACTN